MTHRDVFVVSTARTAIGTFGGSLKDVPNTQLATTVGASLHDSLGASARMAGETIRPVVEQAMATLAQEAERSHQRLREALGVTGARKVRVPRSDRK